MAGCIDWSILIAVELHVSNLLLAAATTCSADWSLIGIYANHCLGQCIIRAYGLVVGGEPVIRTLKFDLESREELRPGVCEI